jgi:hypothetical protein
MKDAKLTIAVILDPEMGDGLRKFAELGPVWLTGSPTNEKAAREYWNSAPPDGHVVTLWSEPRNGTTEEEWLSILDDLELAADAAPCAGPALRASFSARISGPCFGAWRCRAAETQGR